MILHPVRKQAMGNKRPPPEFEKGLGKRTLHQVVLQTQICWAWPGLRCCVQHWLPVL